MTAQLVQDTLTRSVEDYLKAIFSLSAEGRSASTRDIAALLGLSAPSVSGMVKRLNEQGLCDHEPYRGVQLTAEGRRLALRVVRRHRIIESYLVQFLGYGWEMVHEEAEQLEHAVSDQLIERMSAALGHPSFDPHGDPIPEADGTLPSRRYTALADVAEGDAVTIGRVDEGDADRLRYLASIGLMPGVPVIVVARQPFHGPITLRTPDADRVIGYELARVLLCVPAADA